MKEYTLEDLKTTVEFNIAYGLAENAHITKVTADKAHLIIQPIIKALFENNLHTTKMYIEKLESEN